MSMLRVYDKNEGKVTANDIRIYGSKADRTKDFSELKNTTFNTMINNKLTGTSVLLKSYASINSLHS